jgi:tetratricopeptide (TPR) repeat protein
VFNKQGKEKKAVNAYKKAVHINPNNPNTYQNMGAILKKQGKLEEAISCFDKSKTVNSVAHALECFYTLKKYDEFNQRLETIARNNSANLRVAALSAFAAEQLQQKDNYPFCENPLEFISYSHIKNHMKDPNKFIKSILDEMNGRSAEWEPENVTTKSGFQTDAKLFSNPSSNMKTLESIVKEELSQYREKFKNNHGILFQNWPNKTHINAWYVRLLKSGHQDSHIHSGGWVSGVIYLKTIRNPEKEEGAIQFGLHGYDYPIIRNSSRLTYQPTDGDLVLFPSSLFHQTIPVIQNTERCVVAFDLKGPG